MNLLSTGARHSVLAAAVATAALLGAQTSAHAAGFEGYYAPANWTVTELGVPGSIVTSGAPSTLTVIGSDDQSGDFGDTYFTITAQAAGTVSFSWSYTSEDEPEYDGGFYVVTTLENYTLLSATSGESGTISFTVAAGELFGFNVYSEDSTFGAGVLTITDFVAPTTPVPEPATYGMMALGLLAVGASITRRRQR